MYQIKQLVVQFSGTSSSCLLYTLNVAPIIALARQARKYGTFGGLQLLCAQRMVPKEERLTRKL